MAEILDRSVAKYRDTVLVDSKEGEVGQTSGGTSGETSGGTSGGTSKKTSEGTSEGTSGDAGGPKSNYVNFDIAQSVLVSSLEDSGRESSAASDREDDENEGSKTPTG